MRIELEQYRTRYEQPPTKGWRLAFVKHPFGEGGEWRPVFYNLKKNRWQSNHTFLSRRLYVTDWVAQPPTPPPDLSREQAQKLPSFEEFKRTQLSKED